MPDLKCDVTPVVEKTYDDLLHPVLEPTGEIIGLLPKVIYTALLPLRKWIADREKYFEKTGELLSRKLKNVKEENIVTPELYVAVPTIQALSYSLDNEELKNLYANLLAKAMNTETKDFVHPSFVEIIKQLSSTDALVFKEIMNKDCVPIVSLFYANDEYKGVIVSRNFTDINITTHKLMSISIDNLIRLGLIEISDDIIDNEALYQNIITSTEYEQAKSSFKQLEEGYKFYNVKNSIQHTDLSILFYEICVKE